MGMDLITTMLVTKKDTELDWEAGMKAADKLTEADVDLPWIENFILDTDGIGGLLAAQKATATTASVETRLRIARKKLVL